MGRHSEFTQESADAICDMLMDGQSLRAICLLKTMPDKGTVLRWLEAYPGFRVQYARAREIQADTLADEILLLSDKSRPGKKTTLKADGTKETVTGDMVERTRLQIDARKWYASKLAPKKYGDRQQIEHSGSITTKTEDLTDDQIAERLRQIEAARKSDA